MRIKISLSKTLVKALVESLAKAGGFTIAGVERLGADQVLVKLAKPLSLKKLNTVFHNSKGMYWPAGDPKVKDGNYIKLTGVSEGCLSFTADAQ